MPLALRTTDRDPWISVLSAIALVAARGTLLGRPLPAALDLEVAVDALICRLGLAKAEKSPSVPAPMNQEAKKHTRSLKDPWTAELLRLKTEC